MSTGLTPLEFQALPQFLVPKFLPETVTGFFYICKSRAGYSICFRGFFQTIIEDTREKDSLFIVSLPRIFPDDDSERDRLVHGVAVGELQPV